MMFFVNRKDGSGLQTREAMLESIADEKRMYDSIVHGLRAAGWSRFDAEGEALDRIERQRQRLQNTRRT